MQSEWLKEEVNKLLISQLLLLFLFNVGPPSLLSAFWLWPTRLRWEVHCDGHDEGHPGDPLEKMQHPDSERRRSEPHSQKQ